MRRIAFAIVLIFTFVNSAFSQDVIYARRIIDTLTSPYFSGRGYVDNGDKLASEFIANEFKTAGLKPFDQSYFQDFSFKVNSFPGIVSIAFDGKVLKAGEDFHIEPGCPSIKGNFKTIVIDSFHIEDDKEYAKLLKSNFSKRIVILNDFNPEILVNRSRYNTVLEKIKASPALIKIKRDKMIWSVGGSVSKQALIYVKPGPDLVSGVSCQINIQSDYHLHNTRNVIGYVKGKDNPDSFIVITGHYDHLGRMGKDAYFPGANDNASGIAMLIDLARYYGQEHNRPSSSIMFIAFAGEEAGLIGSLYYTTVPLFPLNQISFLLNLDLMGTGDNGMTVVNGSVFKKEFDTLVAINQRMNLLHKIDIRGKAANSDHYHFTEKGVPSFFFYLMSNYYKYYHDVYDRSSGLQLDEFNDCSVLIREFISFLQERNLKH